MRINGVYITNEEAKEIFFSDKKLSKIFRKLYVANLVVFVLLVILQVAFVILEDQSTIRTVVLGFLLISALFLITGVMEYFARKKKNGCLAVGAATLTINLVVWSILSLVVYIGIVTWIVKNSCGTDDDDEECIIVVSIAAVLCIVSLVGVIVSIFGCRKMMPLVCCNPKFDEIARRARDGASAHQTNNLGGVNQPPVAGYTGYPPPPTGAGYTGYPPPPTGAPQFAQPTTNWGQYPAHPPPPPAYDNPVGQNADWQRMEADKAALAIEGLPEKKIDTYPAYNS